MAQQAPRRSTRELRQLFAALTDRAAGLIPSYKACDCGAGTPAADGEDLSTMINDLMPIRQRAGGCTCGPPCDGTKVDDDLSDEALNAMWARLTWRYNLLHEELKAAPCVCGGRPQTPQTPQTPEIPQTPETPESPESPEVPELPVFRLQPTLLGIPEEIRDMIWWEVLAPRDGTVRIWPQTIYPGQDSRIGGAEYHGDRFTVPGITVLPAGTSTYLPAGASQAVPQRQTWRRRNEWHEFPLVHYYPSVNDYNLLLVNHQVYEEAEREFWRRAVTDRLMFSFGPRDLDALAINEEYNGILSAYTFFMTILRENPQYLPRFPGADYLPLIRRVHLDLTDSPWGGRRQALATILRFGQTNAIRYLDDLLDLIHQNLTGLEHLSLAFNGWVPDFSQLPVSGLIWLCASASIY